MQTDPARVTLLIEAAEAYPAFEQRVLSAEREIVLGFRVFDPETRLRSQAARQIGDTWQDLLAYVLRRGVDVQLFLSDFDPLVATDLHEQSWATVRALRAMGAALPPGAGRLSVRPLLHPARLGLLPRAVFWPLIRYRLWRLSGQGALAEHQHRRPRLQAMLDRAHAVTAFPASHHQKVAVIDERWLYIGGLDLDERRYDDPEHRRPAQATWHDVQLLLEDPARARAARDHIRALPLSTAGKRTPAPAPGLLRTLSARRSRPNLWHLSPKTLCAELSDRHLQRIAGAQNLIYLETQFFRDRGLARALAARARENPRLRVILILPAAPETVAFRDRPSLDGRYGDHLQSRCIDDLRAAFGERCLVLSPVQRRRHGGQDALADRAALGGAPIIYVHAKVSVFDDAAAIVSSANLNGRSMRWDTELGVELKEQARHIRDRLHAHWWPGISTPPLDQFFAQWRALVAQNLHCPPDRRCGFLVPYDHDAARLTALAVPGAPEEIV